MLKKGMTKCKTEVALCRKKRYAEWEIVKSVIRN